MKTLLISVLALSALMPRVSEACGNYRPEPRIFRLSTHVIVDTGKNSRRTFALLPNLRAPKDATWSQLSPMSFDSTEITEAKTLTHPMTLTLVGPSGTRVVKSTKHVFLSRMWDIDTPTTGAMEVDAQGFSIAIEGEHAAKWIELEEVKATQKLARWVTAQGVKVADPDSIYVRRVPNTNIETISVYGTGGTKVTTLLKVGDQNHGNFTGNPIGAFTNDGVTQLALVDGARITPVYLGAAF